MAEHIAGESRAANLLGLTSDGVATAPPLVPLLDEEGADFTVQPVLAEIRAWSREHLGWDRVPAFWRAIASQPRYLAAAWAKTRLVLASGEIDQLTKMVVALECAALAGSRYFVEYYQAAFRRLGFDDCAVVELAALVNHYTSFNTVAHALQLEAPATAAFASHPPARSPLPPAGDDQGEGFRVAGRGSGLGEE